MKNKKFLGFTLAEMLVVIGIIGIVSALTLPNLNNSTGDQEKVAKFLKVHQNLNEALARAVIAYGPFYDGVDGSVPLWFRDLNTTNDRMVRFGKRMTKYMKVQKICNIGGSGCFKSGNITFLGGGVSSESNTGYKVILADGTSVSFEYGWMHVDIDGPNRGKNQFGEDIFTLAVSDDGRSIVGNQEKAPANQQSFERLLSACKTGSGVWASTWVLRYGNMDYKKVNSSGKCPNGTTPTESNPRCK